MHTASKIAVTISIFFIRVYQKFLSPDHSFWRFVIQRRICRFHPTCSDYAIIALQNKGFLKGWRMALIRVSKCHPFNQGGYDPVK